MNPKVRKALQFILFFGLGLGLMWWQFSRFDANQRDQFFFALTHANYWWMALAVLVGALAHLSRAIRWQQLLTPLGHKASIGNRFYAVMIGYLANYGLPRSGEVIRCGLLKSNENVPFAESFGTVVVERIVDTLCLFLVFIIVLITEFTQLQSLWNEYIWNPFTGKLHDLGQNRFAMILLIASVVLFFGSLFLLRKKIGSIITGRFGAFVKGFKDGLLAVRRVPNPGWFIFHSLFIWSGYLFSLYICFFCFPVTHGLSLNTALILLIFGTFGVIFTPGGIGAYQVIVTSVLIYILAHQYDYKAEAQEVAPFAWLSWGAQVFTVIIFSAVALAVKPIFNRKPA